MLWMRGRGRLFREHSRRREEGGFPYQDSMYPRHMRPLWASLVRASLCCSFRSAQKAISEYAKHQSSS